MIIGCNDYLDRLRFSGIIVILILLKINRGNWPLHSEKLFEDTYWIMNIWSWPIYFALWITWHDITCATLHLSDITCTTLYLLLPLSTLSHDLDTHCNHYLKLIFFTLFSNHAHWVTLSCTYIQLSRGYWGRL